MGRRPRTTWPSDDAVRAGSARAGDWTVFVEQHPGRPFLTLYIV
jgi:hypothetical protein